MLNLTFFAAVKGQTTARAMRQFFPFVDEVLFHFKAVGAAFFVTGQWLVGFLEIFARSFGLESPCKGCYHGLVPLPVLLI